MSSQNTPYQPILIPPESSLDLPKCVKALELFLDGKLINLSDVGHPFAAVELLGNDAVDGHVDEMEADDEVVDD